uniref:Uncharacterized protein n=1 Tax=Anguilla anguilla TaxID=7936 RepID=A0A0E9QUU0_ANGAN
MLSSIIFVVPIQLFHCHVIFEGLKDSRENTTCCNFFTLGFHE